MTIKRHWRIILFITIFVPLADWQTVGAAEAMENIDFMWFLGKEDDSLRHRGRGYSRPVNLRSELMEEADNGDGDSQFTLAIGYHNGLGDRGMGDLKTDFDKSRFWMAKSADSGLDFARCTYIALCFLTDAPAEDVEKALEYCRLYSEKGYREARNNYAVCHAIGYGVEKNQKLAAEMFSSVVGNEMVEAEYNLGLCYFNGWGVERDLEQADDWFERAKHHAYDEKDASWARKYLDRIQNMNEEEELAIQEKRDEESRRFNETMIAENKAREEEKRQEEAAKHAAIEPAVSITGPGIINLDVGPLEPGIGIRRDSQLRMMKLAEGLAAPRNPDDPAALRMSNRLIIPFDGQKLAAMGGAERLRLDQISERMARLLKGYPAKLVNAKISKRPEISTNGDRATLHINLEIDHEKYAAFLDELCGILDDMKLPSRTFRITGETEFKEFRLTSGTPNNLIDIKNLYDIDGTIPKEEDHILIIRKFDAFDESPDSDKVASEHMVSLKYDFETTVYSKVPRDFRQLFWRGDFRLRAFYLDGDGESFGHGNLGADEHWRLMYNSTYGTHLVPGIFRSPGFKIGSLPFIGKLSLFTNMNARLKGFKIVVYNEKEGDPEMDKIMRHLKMSLPHLF